MLQKIRCVVVDDENLGRKLVEENIQHFPFLTLAGSCRNAFEAIEILQNEEIDLIFLDIQMPGMLGTQLLKSLPKRPLVIFITAYSDYAVESYDLDVVDYLLKPVSLERFAKAVNKAWEVFAQKQIQQAQLGTTPTVGHFFVHVEYALVKIVIQDITHIEGMGDYVKIYLNGVKKPVITKSSLKGIEEKLPAASFFRVHKSYIVHLEKIERIRNREIGIGEHNIPVGEAQLEELMQKIG